MVAPWRGLAFKSHTVQINTVMDVEMGRAIVAMDARRLKEIMHMTLGEKAIDQPSTPMEWLHLSCGDES